MTPVKSKKAIGLAVTVKFWKTYGVWYKFDQDIWTKKEILGISQCIRMLLYQLEHIWFLKLFKFSSKILFDEPQTGEDLYNEN